MVTLCHRAGGVVVGGFVVVAAAMRPELGLRRVRCAERDRPASAGGSDAPVPPHRNGARIRIAYDATAGSPTAVVRLGGGGDVDLPDDRRPARNRENRPFQFRGHILRGRIRRPVVEAVALPGRSRAARAGARWCVRRTSGRRSRARVDSLMAGFGAPPSCRAAVPVACWPDVCANVSAGGWPTAVVFVHVCSGGPALSRPCVSCSDVPSAGQFSLIDSLGRDAPGCRATPTSLPESMLFRQVGRLLALERAH